MSVSLGFPISGLEEPIYNTNRFDLQCVGIFLGGCLTCEELSGGYLEVSLTREELVGVTIKRWWGWIIVLSFFHLQSFQRWFHLFRMSFRSTFFQPSILLHTFYHQTKCMFLDHSYSHPLIPLHTCLH